MNKVISFVFVVVMIFCIKPMTAMASGVLQLIVMINAWSEAVSIESGENFSLFRRFKIAFLRT